MDLDLGQSRCGGLTHSFVSISSASRIGSALQRGLQRIKRKEWTGANIGRIYSLSIHFHFSSYSSCNYEDRQATANGQKLLVALSTLSTNSMKTLGRIGNQ